jgi:DedD protein
MALHEGELFKEKVEVNLDGRQIFSLFCGGAVIASLVFVLGVSVGRRVEAREHGGVTGPSGASDPLAALDQMAAEAAARPEAELAFASTLRGERDGDPLGAIDRSLERANRDDEAKPDVDAPPEPARAAPPAAIPAKPQPVKPELKAVAQPEPKDAKAEAKPEVKDVKAEAKPAQAAGDGRFTLHLQSFQDRSLADALVGRLKKDGYQPYVVEQVEQDKGTWYRVRVGRYPTFEDAVTGKTDFEKKMSIIAYVMRSKK